MKRANAKYIMLLVAVILIAIAGIDNDYIIPDHKFITNEAATAVDGDTLKLTFRLIGVDTPEMKQKCKKDGKCYNCGAEAKQFLNTLIENQNVECVADGKDRYSRTLARCYINGRQVNINQERVRKGYGFVHPNYSQEYAKEQEEAKAAKRGLWASEFVYPWEWRKTKEKCLN